MPIPARPEAVSIAAAVARIVLGDANNAMRSAADLRAHGAWHDAVRLAVAMHVVPPLRQRVARWALPLDDEAQRALHAASAAAAAQSAATAHRAVTVLKTLAAHGVRATAIKGIAAMANLYRGPGQRMLSDIDVLIDVSDLARACETLATIGFTCRIIDLEAYLTFLANRPQAGVTSGHHFLVFTDANGIEVDLHWRLSAEPPAGLQSRAMIERGEIAPLLGTPIRALAPIDAIMVLTHHVVRDNFHPHTTLKDLSELAEWWRVQPQRWPIDELQRQAGACGLASPLLALCRLLTSYDRDSRARAGSDGLTAVASPRERADAERLGDLFDGQLFGRTLNHDLLALLSPLVVLRFARRRLTQWNRTDYFARQLEATLDLPPRRPLISRVASVMRDLAHLTPTRLAEYRSLLRAHQMAHADD